MSGERVLVADDNPQLIKALLIRLQRDGYAVTTANDSYGALAKIVSERPDVILLDVNMPAGDGFTVQERMQAFAHTNAPNLADIPVIYMTADKSERLDAIAYKLGAIELIHKPFQYRELAAVIRSALQPPPLPATG